MTFTGDWTHDAGIVGVLGCLFGYLLAVVPDWLTRRRERRDRARGVPTRRAR